MLRDASGIQLSPCICAKAKYALGLKAKYDNDATCSQKYWNKTVEFIGKGAGLPFDIIESAKKKKELFLRIT